METGLRFYFALSVLVSTISVHFCTLLWKRRHTSLGRASFLLMLAFTVWLVPTVLAWMIDNYTASVIVLKISYTGAFFLPPAWLAYAIFLIGKETLITRKRMLLLLVIPSLLTLLLFTNQYWKGLTRVDVGWITFLEVTPSAWQALWLVYSYTLDGVGILLIIWSVLRAPQRYLHRGAIILVGFLIPILASLENNFDLIPGLVVDLTPISMLVTVLIMLVGGVRYQLFDVIPVARDALVERAVDGMIVIDETGRVLDLNISARAILGKTLYEALNKPLAELLPAAAELIERIRSLGTTRKELAVQQAGRVCYYELNLSAIHRYDGRRVGSLVVLHDITERKQAELQLQEAYQKEAQLVQAKSRFVAVASHSFRTPLAALQSSAQLLETYYERWPEQKRKEHLRRIGQSISLMNQVLQRMLAYEEMQSGKYVPQPVEVDLEQLCQRAVRELETGADRPMFAFVNHTSQKITALQDEDLLHLVVVNILSNAFKYTPPEKSVRLDLWVDGPEARIEVRDEGIGIPAEDLPHLCEAFFRGSNITNQPGSGLGMLIVEKALQLINGRLQVESQEDIGTLVRVTFPLRLVIAAQKGAEFRRKK